MNILRRVLAVAAGIAVGLAFVMLGDYCSSLISPWPKGVDYANKQAIADVMAHVPVIAFLIMLLFYAIGSFLGGAVATLITGRTILRPAMIVGIMLTIGNLLNQMELPHPIWFAVASTLIYVPCAWLGFALLKPKVSA